MSTPRGRVDARRNREQILATAIRLFAADGVEMPMREIAREASVGVATLYRCFPDREALILAVARQSYSAALTHVRAARAEEPTAWDTFEQIIRYVLQIRLSFQLMNDPIAGEVIKADQESIGYLDEIVKLSEETMATAQAEGSMRTDVGLSDVLMLYNGIVASSASNPDSTSDISAQRGLAIILDGLRTTSPSPLPGKPAPFEKIVKDRC